MRLAIDPRRWRLLRQLPRYSWVSAIELVLFALLAVQCARLLWVTTVPIGPLGDWRPSGIPDQAQARAALTSGFDPFFRLGGGSGPAVVTSLQLKLFGVRLDEATGRGSAIIAGPDDVQTSYAVGEEIQPGVTLKSVGFDSVVIARGGADETLYLDQSAPPPAPVTPSDEGSDLFTETAAPANVSPGTVRLADLQAGLTLAPRQAEGRTTGLVPGGDPALLARLGLRPGDVVVQVAGRPVSSAEDLRRAAAGLAGGGNLSIAVERGAQIVPVVISISGS